MGIAADDSGGTGPAIVVLPSFGMTRAAMALAFQPAFDGAGGREIYLDLPGHGDSTSDVRPEAEAVLEAVCSWLDHHEDADVTFTGPVSVVNGRQDRIVGYSDQFRAMSRYPRGTFAVVDEAGHYLPFEQPALLRSLAQDWLGRVRA